ncbi:hypothetical protein AMS58_07295 [Pseudoalteromonas porphyrae]|uniref:DUF3223 domain-containing protein n=1 Tax=Pseudoalteromonas porphyrae TaxID=187330 RepID=UPI0006BAC4BF|nr:DUF3223 domain-containing protein [Pseudoalteromonas porphyrae]KPH95155.1 hypothetical protein AMS58_07295 [Pseudoalteromonas porphyrae]
MAKPIQLQSGISFQTQSQAIEYFKKILNTETVISRSHPEFANVLALYLRHHEFTLKSGSEDNINMFCIKNTGQFNTKCFHAIHFDDSTDADWSYKSAITAKEKTNFQCFTDAARSLLESSEYKFRDKDFTYKCEKFIEGCDYKVDNFPSSWISKPDKLQYRSSLTKAISGRFIDWYEKYEN